MTFNRTPAKDPRTVARDIPGIFDIICPQLTSSITAALNKKAKPIPNLEAISEEMIKGSTIERQMLFEIAYARAEQLLKNKPQGGDWEKCIDVAKNRQRRFLKEPVNYNVEEIDIIIAQKVADNLLNSLSLLSNNNCSAVYSSPIIPGYHWIASGNGDFAINQHIIEVKCTERHFSSADYRQIIMYWILSYAESVENSSGNEWETGTLLNPRRNLMFTFSFSELLSIVTPCKSKIELLELFTTIIKEYVFSQRAFE